MNKLPTIKFNDVLYTTKIDEKNQVIVYQINNPRKEKLPEYLYKYYALNNYSVEALIKNYFFSSHPYLLNDKYDCSGDIIDYSDLNLETYIHHLVNDYGYYSEKELKRIFNSDEKFRLDIEMSNLHQLKLYRQFGVLSMTETPNNPLMWTHYAQNTGFLIKFKTSSLPKGFFGPFPINYAPKFERISFKKYEFSLCILFQTNIKHIDWLYENEWRYLIFNEHGNYHPFYSKQDINSRKFQYNPNSIQEIILGYGFFSGEDIDFNKRTPKYDIIDFTCKKSKNVKNKIRVLNFIVNYNIPCFQIIRYRFKYEIEPKEIRIKKLSRRKFKVFNPFKFIKE